MKVDIEGAEISALKGGSNKLKRLLKVTVEVHCDNLLTAKSHFKLQMTDKPGTAALHRIEVTKLMLKESQNYPLEKFGSKCQKGNVKKKV